MTNDEWLDCAKLITAAWPHAPLEDPTLALYFQQLVGLDGELVAKAVSSLLKKLDFPPTIHQLVDEYKYLLGESMRQEENNYRALEDASRDQKLIEVHESIIALMNSSERPFPKAVSEIMKMFINPSLPIEERHLLQEDFNQITGQFNLNLPTEVELCRRQLNKYLETLRIASTTDEELDALVAAHTPVVDEFN